MKKIYTLSKLDYRDRLVETLNVISDTVSSTLGPNGKTCILYDGEAIPHVTKDGVTVAEFIQFSDPFQEAISRIVKETARKTGELVGDGTTTSILLACKLTEQIVRELALDDKTSILELLEEVDSSINEVILNIKSSITELDIFDSETIDILRSIISLSSNGDREITKFIVDTLNTIGADGIIDVVISNNEVTSVKTQEGMLIEAPAFVHKTINVSNPAIALVSSSIEKVHELKSCLELSYNLYRDEKKALILIAKEFSKEIQEIVTVNNRMNKTNLLLVESDGFALNMFEILDDMASLLDCKILSTDSTSEFGLQNISKEHLSVNVTNAIVSPQQTVLHSSEFLTDENIKLKNNLLTEIDELKKSGESKLGEISGLQKRLTKFSKSATIHVGGFTDAEKFEKKDRVDDAVKALESAINGGVIPGGGYSLYTSSRNVKSNIVKNVCAIPGTLLSQNVNIDIQNIYDEGKVMDFATTEVGLPYSLGILDPANVSIKALQQAMVIVRLLLNTHSIIVPEINEI